MGRLVHLRTLYFRVMPTQFHKVLDNGRSLLFKRDKPDEITITVIVHGADDPAKDTLHDLLVEVIEVFRMVVTEPQGDDGNAASGPRPPA